MIFHLHVHLGIGYADLRLQPTSFVASVLEFPQLANSETSYQLSPSPSIQHASIVLFGDDPILKQSTPVECVLIPIEQLFVPVLI